MAGFWRGVVIGIVLMSVGTYTMYQLTGKERPVTPFTGAPVTGNGAAQVGDDRLVAMKDIRYAPATLTVTAGTTVTWRNDDPVWHTVTPEDKGLWGSEGSGDAPDAWLAEGETWSFTFTKPGTYGYYCVPHVAKADDGKSHGMVATVIVLPSGAATPPVAALPNTTVVPDPVAPERLRPGPDGKVHIELETREVLAQLSDGAAYAFWTFDGTVPGPMLRIREGDDVELTLRNAADSKSPHSIDLHAVTGPGGGARVTQTDPGKTTTFTWKAMNPGLYVYHCATPHVPTHVANGMYGLILVEPEDSLPPVDREYFAVQGEVYTKGDLGDAGVQEFSLDSLFDEEPDYYLMNGRVGALTGNGSLKADVGETVRIYFGVGGMVPSSFHVIGEIFDAVWPEGSMAAPQEDVQTTLVPAGGSAIVQFDVEVPGDYILVDHWLTHAIDRGALGILHVEGEPAPDVFHGEETAGSGH